MKKIMIVDDELLVRVGIKSIVEWDEHGYQMVAEASNGKEALELIEKYRPDIVMTDLVMAPVDGFELIEECGRRFPEIKFIVLSSYNDMDNVKRAMKLGATDYVFKLKVTADSILSTLSEASKEIDSAARPFAADQPVSVRNIPAIKSRLLHTIIDKSYISRKEIEKQIQELELNVNFSESFVMLYISIDDFAVKVLEGEIQGEQLLKYSMANIVEEVLAKSFLCDVYDYAEGNLIALLQKNRSDADMAAEVRDVFSKIQEYMKRYLAISVSAALSHSYSDLTDISAAYSEAMEGVKNRLYKGCGYLNLPRKGNNTKKVLKISPDGIDRDMEKKIDASGEQLIQYFNRFFDAVSALDNVEESEVRKSYFEMYHSLSDNARNYGVNIDALTDEQRVSLYDIILKGDTSTLIRSGFLAAASRFAESLGPSKKQSARKDILMAKDFVRNNLSEHLTVATVSEFLNMNASYFSHLFKKETGKSFIDYVNETRINKAKELLATTDYRVYEISAMVGIDSPNYFSILFKKITGKSPNDIRSRQ